MCSETIQLWRSSILPTSSMSSDTFIHSSLLNMPREISRPATSPWRSLSFATALWPSSLVSSEARCSLAISNGLHFSSLLDQSLLFMKRSSSLGTVQARRQCHCPWALRHLPPAGAGCSPWWARWCQTGDSCTIPLRQVPVVAVAN